MMKLKREDRVKILEYKFVFEEIIQIKKEYQEGTADLNYRLSFFRDRLNCKNKEQKTIFDSIFMGKNVSNPQIKNTSLDTSNSKNELSQSAKKSKNDTATWAKKMYKSIVKITHPDKTKGVSSDHLIERLTEQYIISQNAYTSGIYSDLIMVAFDLNIDIPENVIDKEVTPNTDRKKNKIKETKKMLGWVWYHVPDEQKDSELKKILVNYGFDFTSEQVKDVIKRKYVKRKVGTRPERLSRQRKKLT